MSTPLLKTGSYLIRFVPIEPITEVRYYDGTLRISRETQDGKLLAADDNPQDSVLRASADLYVHSSRTELEELFTESYKKLALSNVQIPVFPRLAYRFYLEGLDVYEGRPAEENVTIRFRVHEYVRSTRSFVARGNRVCILARLPIEEMLNEGKDDPRDKEFRRSADYFGGRIIDEESGNVVGKVRVGRLSNYLRIAEVEIDRVASIPTPTETKVMLEGNLTTVNWSTAFEGTGWEVTPKTSNTTVEQPEPAEGEPYREDGAWTLSELHQAMMLWHDARRDETKILDSAWLYYVLCVRRLAEFERGVMFDAGGCDAENIPHDFIAIESDWPFPDKTKKDKDRWGKIRELGKTFGETQAYFRTAVHEMGHATGLEHNHEDNGFMNTTDAIADNPRKGNLFPDNIDWHFHPRDQARLRHESDARVRPDTSCEGAAIIQPDTDDTKPNEGLRLHLSPHLQSVPYGAPVRIQFRLENASDKPIEVPEDFSLKSGNVRGRVTDPTGIARTFSPVVWRMDDYKLKKLKERSQDNTYSATLLRGPEGALFRVSGPHRIRLDLSWTDGKAHVSLSEETVVTVTPPMDEDHRISALIALATPDTLLSLAIGGDHLVRGNIAIDTALKNPVLRPHFAVVEAKRLVVRYRACKRDGNTFRWEKSSGRKPDLTSAFALIEDNTVLAPDEIYKLATLTARILDGIAKSKEVKALDKADRAKFDEEFKKLVDVDAIIKLGKNLKSRVERLVAYGKLHAKDRAVAASKRLDTQTEILNYVYGRACPREDPKPPGGPDSATSV